MANARLGWFSPLGVAASIRVAVRRVGLRAHCFRFSARADSEWLLGELVLPPSVSEIALGGLVLPLGGLVFGLTASAFRHVPIRGCRWASWFFRLPLRRFCSAGWFFRSAVGLRAHCFRFSACTASEWSLGEFVLPPSASEIPLGGLAFGLTASAFRHAPLRSGCWASSFFRLPLRRFRSTGWSSGFRFGDCPRRVGSSARWLAFGFTASAFRHAPIRTAAPPKRGPTEHNDTTLVSLQTLIPTC